MLSFAVTFCPLFFLSWQKAGVSADLQRATDRISELEGLVREAHARSNDSEELIKSLHASVASVNASSGKLQKEYQATLETIRAEQSELLQELAEAKAEGHRKVEAVKEVVLAFDNRPARSCVCVCARALVRACLYSLIHSRRAAGLRLCSWTHTRTGSGPEVDAAPSQGPRLGHGAAGANAAAGERQGGK